MNLSVLNRIHVFAVCEVILWLVDLLGLTVRVLELGLALNKARHGSEVVAGDAACSVRSSEHVFCTCIILSEEFLLAFPCFANKKWSFINYLFGKL